LKIKLAVSNERFEEIRKKLIACGIEIDDNADFVLYENSNFLEYLIVRDTITNERVVLPVEDIAYIETFGHLVEVHTKSHTYQAMDRLYKIFNQLDPEKFLRISNSVVISRRSVVKITPTLSMKFILTMSDGKNVDVTRSYYYIFKENFGI